MGIGLWVGCAWALVGNLGCGESNHHDGSDAGTGGRQPDSGAHSNAGRAGGTSEGGSGGASKGGAGGSGGVAHGGSGGTSTGGAGGVDASVDGGADAEVRDASSDAHTDGRAGAVSPYPACNATIDPAFRPYPSLDPHPPRFQTTVFPAGIYRVDTIATHELENVTTGDASCSFEENKQTIEIRVAIEAGCDSGTCAADLTSGSTDYFVDVFGLTYFHMRGTSFASGRLVLQEYGTTPPDKTDHVTITVDENTGAIIASGLRDHGTLPEATDQYEASGSLDCPNAPAYSNPPPKPSFALPLQPACLAPGASFQPYNGGLPCSSYHFGHSSCQLQSPCTCQADSSGGSYQTCCPH